MYFIDEEVEVSEPQSWLAKQDLSTLDPSNLTPLTKDVSFFIFSFFVYTFF